MKLTRREFVALSTPALVSLGTLSPRFLLSAAEQAQRDQQQNILVVIQMSGGNDGLNTVVPFDNDEYHKARPTLAFNKSDVLKINDTLGFHPAARGFADLLEQNRLGIVQGVGYPNPNRSHFESMDIWHTCLRKTDERLEGWLGGAINQLQKGRKSDVPAIHLGDRKQPFALTSRDYRVPSVKSLEQFRLEVEKQESLNQIRNSVNSNRAAASPLLDFVQTSTDTAIDVSQKLQAVAEKYKSTAAYPETPIGQQLKTVSQLINADLATSVYYLEIDGFDTHSQQANAHEVLLRRVGDALSVFHDDIDLQGHGDRVLSLVFSEFGRRVAENASKGTDHGTAAPMFVAGNQVRSGLIGDHSSLDDLDEGDLRFHTDFRQVYAGILRDWLKVPGSEILHGKFEPVPVVA